MSAGRHLYRELLDKAHSKLKEERRPRTRDRGETLKPGDFFLKQDVEGIWHEYLLPIIRLSCLEPRAEIVIGRTLILTLAILILIDAIEVIERFAEHFAVIDANIRPHSDIRHFCDHHLPVSPSLLEFLSPAKRDMFLQIQHHFKPIVIDQNQDYHGDNMLTGPIPFEVLEANVTGGAFGTIHRVLIHAHHLRVGVELKTENTIVACKRFKKHVDLRREVLRLSSLRKGAERHDHIVLSYAVFNTTEEKSIFFPWADLGDLTGLLYHEKEEVYRQPLPLLVQASRLAGALRWLHRPISGRRECIAHMDFKPRNILRFRSNESVVGTWKLSDFGVAITDARPGTKATTIWDWQRVLHPEQAFQEYNAPELVPLTKTTSVTAEITEELLKADVWSFGCVLLDILAFARDGSEKVDELSDARWAGYRDGRYYSDGQGEQALKTCIREWIDLISPDESAWIRQCRGLIEHALRINPAERLTIVEVERVLDGIVESLSPEVTARSERGSSHSGSSARSIAVNTGSIPDDIVPPSTPPAYLQQPRYSHPENIRNSDDGRTLSLQQTPSLRSPNHLTPLSTSPPSTRSRSGSPPTPFARHLRKSSHTIGRDEIPKHTRQEVIDVAFNHNAEMIAFLIKQTRLPMAFFSRQRVEPDSFLVRTWRLHLTEARYTEQDVLQLSDHKGAWKHVLLAYPLVCVWGVSGQRKSIEIRDLRDISNDLGFDIVRRIEDLTGLSQILLTTYGVVVFKRKRRIHVSCIGNTAGWAEEPEGSHEFVHIALSPSQDRLYAWAQANGELDCLYSWTIHTSPLALSLSDRTVSWFDTGPYQDNRCLIYPLNLQLGCIVTISSNLAALAVAAKVRTTKLQWIHQEESDWLAVTTHDDGYFVRLVKRGLRLLLYVHVLDTSNGRVESQVRTYQLENALAEPCSMKIGRQDDNQLVIVICGLDKQLYFVRPHEGRNRQDQTPRLSINQFPIRHQ